MEAASMRILPRPGAAQEKEFANRLADALATADSLLTAWPERPTWCEKAVLGLRQRSACAGKAVTVLHKAGCCLDMANVARVAFESMITALHILHDPEPNQRARQYTDIMLYTRLVQRRRYVLDLGITPGVQVVKGQPAEDWLNAQVDKAKQDCDPLYRDSEEWKVWAMCEGLGLRRLYLRCYRPLCAYAHPDPMVLDRLALEPLGADTLEDWRTTANMALGITAGCLEVLNEIATVTQKRRGSKMLHNAWHQIESFMENVFPPGTGRLLGPPPARPAPTRATTC